jgi:PAS domain S-box-containing protein
MNTTPFHVLLAEDEAAHVEAIRRAFKTAGTKVDLRAVATLREYRACLAEWTPDLALIDLNLPDGRAVEVLTHPPEDAAFPVLVMTAFGSQEIVVEVMKAGALDFVVKSTEAFAAMPHTVARILREWRLLQARKQAEESVRNSEAQFRAMFELASIGMAQANPQTGQWVRVNQKMCAITGYSAADMLQMRVSEITHPEDRAADWEAYQRVVRGEAPDYRLEKRYLRKDGTVAWVNVNMTIIRDAAGTPTRTMATIEDITERKRAEEALQESGRMIEGIINSMPLRVFWKDKDLAYLGCNTVFARDAGCADPKDLIGKDDFQMVWREQAEAYRADDRAVIESGRAKLLIEESQTTPTGDTITLLTSKLPLRNSQGEITGVLGMYMDITERKRAETEIKNEQALSNAIIEGIPGTFYMLDENGKYVRWNAYQRDEIVGKPDAEVSQTFARDTIHPDDRALILSKIENVLKDDVPKVVEGRVLLRGGPAFVWLLMTGRRIILNGRPFLVGIGIDITERKLAEEEHSKLEAQLRQAQKMEAVGRLAGGVAHDYNNLIMGIMGYVELCRDKIAPDHPIREWLDEIMQDAERSAKITGQLLAFARKQVIAPKILDLNDAVAGMLKLLRRLIGEDINLAWRPGAALQPVKLDPSQVDQILANLCVNARDAIAGVGEIALETGSTTVDADFCDRHPEALPGAYAFLAVSDDGCGMDKETLAQVFEPFFTTKGLGKGTGLGLATVYGIVKQNNGFIYAYSEPGKGTTFKIYLPQIAAEVVATTIPSKAEVPRGQGETILLVEDEKSLRVTCRLFLGALGYNVLVAETPGEALEITDQHPGDIQILLTDVVMPGMDGRQLAKRIIAAKTNVKVLYMSGYTADVIAQRGVLDEGVQFLSKPFTRDDLARKVHDMLKGQ